jgi:hypothetical protein
MSSAASKVLIVEGSGNPVAVRKPANVFSNHTATVTVTLPVHHIFQSPVDGPNRPDWHIYETIYEHINIGERTLQNIRSMIAGVQRISR